MRLYGLTELANATGISRGKLAVWHQRGKMPAPTARLACGSVWTGRPIERWIRQQNAKRSSEAK